MSSKILPATLVIVIGLAVALSYRSAREEKAVSRKDTQESSRQSVASKPSSMNTATSVAKVPSTPATPIPLGASATIIERAGHSKDSSDIILAMIRHPELNLSKEEMELLLTTYLDAVQKRSNFEASIARVEVVSDAEKNIIIPPYRETGLKLQADLYRAFASILGDARGAQVKEALQSELYFRNYGFGESEQRITVALTDLASPGIYYKITHNVETIHANTKDNGGNMRESSISVNGAVSILSINDLSDYNAFIELFPKGGKS